MTLNNQDSIETKFIPVSEFLGVVNTLFDLNFSPAFVRGEISEMSRPSSGHLYFTIKDDRAELACVMWRGNIAGLSFSPKVGDSVLCAGRLVVYEKAGRMQFSVLRLEPEGEGILRKKFLELKTRLEIEGIFAKERKRPLPFIPKRIGIITSSTGAVIHDMLVRFQNRFPGLAILVMDARVQGENATKEIIEAVEFLNQRDLVDIIVLARGGGSLMDLQPFNEESLVRAVFASRIAVVSAVGHEVDVTLCDLVADLRAPTPTAAADMIVPKKEDLVEKITALEDRLEDVFEIIQDKRQIVDEETIKFDNAVLFSLNNQRLRMKSAATSIQSFEPSVLVKMMRERLSAMSYRLQIIVQRTFERKKDILISCVLRLDASDHKKLLKRGYSIVRKGKKLIKKISDISPGDEVTVTLSEGVFGATVTQLSEEK